MEKLHIKRDDTVVVLSGESKGTRGKVIATSPEEGKVIVAGANIVSKHARARRQGEKSQIVKTESAIYASKVQLVCPKCDAGRRFKKVISYTEKNGKKVKVITRICTKCGAEM